MTSAKVLQPVERKIHSCELRAVRRPDCYVTSFLGGGCAGVFVLPSNGAFSSDEKPASDGRRQNCRGYTNSHFFH